MFELQHRTPEIKEASEIDGRLYLTANIGAPINLFQAQTISVLTGVAIKSDQLVFAVPTKINNKRGLIPGAGIEMLETEGGEIEILMYNRNVPGQQRMIEITPGMVIAEIVVMPRYCMDVTKVDPGQEKPTLASLKKLCDDKKIEYKAKATIKELTELLAAADK